MSADLPERRLRILLAEDNAVNQRLAATLLERRGHRVTIARNGREALAALDRQRFDVVLMDVQMPEMGGFEATAAIRARERGTGTHMPIVAMTAHAMKGDRERCREAGMDDYLSKPLDSRRLCVVVESVVAGHPAATSSAAGSDGVVNYEAVLARVGGDTDLLVDVSRLFIDGVPAHLREIRSALDAQDAQALRRAAHAFKGAAANFEARALVDAARRLEEFGRTGELEDCEAAWETLTGETAELMTTLRTFVARKVS